MEAYNQDTTNTIWAGVVFLGDFTSGWPTNINYKLRVALRKGQEDRDRWRTDRTYVFFSTFGYRNNVTEGAEPCKFLITSASYDKYETRVRVERRLQGRLVKQAQPSVEETGL